MRTTTCRMLLSIALMLGVLQLSPAAAQGLPGCDFDGDGYHDLAIGTPGESEGGLPSSAGAVNVIYGSKEGLTASYNQFWSQDSPGVKGVAELGDRFGAALACGDFNDDTWDDLAVAVPGENITGTTFEGAVHILLGSATGLTADRDQLWHAGNISGTGLKSSRVLGSALASGDFDDDGHDDLAIGGPETNNGEGVVIVLYGDTLGLTDVGSQLWSRETPGIEGTATLFDAFGTALTSGDFDDDEHDDLAIGVPGDSAIDGAAGGVHVILGAAGGLTSVGSSYWHQSLPDTEDQAENSDFCGFSLAAGDFDRDGHDDLAMGCPAEGLKPHLPWWGGVHVFYGCDDGICVKGNHVITQDTVGVQGVAEQDDEFGYSLTAADFDGDDFCDLAVGAHRDSEGADHSGSVNVLYGTTSGLFGWNQIFHQNTESILGVAEPEDRFGSSLTSGDFDGDGVSDLAIGSYRDSPSGVDGGSVNVIYGTIFLLQPPGNQLWSQDSAFILGTQDSGSRFGHLGDDPEYPF